MELKDCINASEELKGLLCDIVGNISDDCGNDIEKDVNDSIKIQKVIEKVRIMESFCRSVLETKGIPQKITMCINGGSGEMKKVAFNAACDLWQAWLANVLDVDTITSTIEKFSDEYYENKEGDVKIIVKTEFSDLAAAIVKEIMGK